MDETKLDPASREQLRIIAIETSIEELRKASFERLATLENRVKVLEEARQRQITLNSTFVQKGEEVIAIAKKPVDKPKDKPKWWW